jgi:hypothetical protein
MSNLVNVRFLIDYTVDDDSGMTYRAGQTYKMTPPSARHFENRNAAVILSDAQIAAEKAEVRAAKEAAEAEAAKKKAAKEAAEAKAAKDKADKETAEAAKAKDEAEKARAAAKAEKSGGKKTAKSKK